MLVKINKSLIRLNPLPTILALLALGLTQLEAVNQLI